MATLRIRLSLLLTYFVFAILLNSVGTVILQVIHTYQISKEAASVLEGFKDIPIAVVSFIIASYLPRLGYKTALQIALALVTLACIAMPLLPAFWTTKLLFLTVGASFALVKVSVYASIGVVTETKAEHASLLNFIEGGFMLGVLSGYWLFSAFMDPAAPQSSGWLQVYWLLALLCAANLALLSSTPFPKLLLPPTQPLKQDFIAMLQLVYKPLVFVFVLSAFLYVLIEQGIGSWLPTFNNEVLQLPNQLSVQLTSIFAASLALGRILAGVILKKMSWYWLLNSCLAAMALLILLTLPLTRNIVHNADVSLFSAPLAAYLFPLIGLFMAPIYPVINSVMLSALPKVQHAPMTGLIVVFSALGGTTGSMVTGYTFANFDGQTAFYLCLLPLSLLVLSVGLFHRQSKQVPV
ncbi:MAG: MFS transporter [Gammaproteobacteria bacterium]|nr:MFS transporter [Gammaproteobacteria bacterium]MBU1554603.1 MFS transporter [Gammaproteobacteria bacterium]MBU2071720.1 MFS transporter [Gammaproteobacteria bacterium]MBU2182375.1 MFS transporter [Gammaproteobacteria bacterium]MBU2203554.1 MFS transporter [Gammaproteobacteria bacterium]